MRVRGATLTAGSCEKTGVDGGSRIHASCILDRAPFILTVDLSTAPVVMATSYHNVTAILDVVRLPEVLQATARGTC
jgi:hypothetical protein